MKKPLPIDHPIDNKRISRWLGLFSNYRNSVTRQQIDDWLSQYSSTDRNVAARLLDSVEFVTYQQICAAFRAIMGGLDGWDVDPMKRQGKWRFAPFSNSSGKSGDSMIHIFRKANKLSYNQFSDLFIYRRDLFGQDLGPGDTVVLVDDFAGTGDTVCSAGLEDFKELLPGNPSIILILVRAITSAKKRIERETDLIVHPYMQLSERDNLFSSKCKHFSDDEKKIILKYCKIADSKSPKGYRDSGIILVFAHDCPSNSIPILHANSKKWCGLFPRSY